MRSDAEIQDGRSSWAKHSSGAFHAGDMPLRLRTARQRQLARRLVELHRLEQPQERPELSELDLAAFVCAVCSDYPDVEIVTRFDSSTLLSDSRHLAAIMFAVLENALVHGAPPVRVSIERHGIVVSDCGPGFSDALLFRATERFATGSPARGVGLGLALAAAHARIVGASLEVCNVGGGGAEVAIVIVPPSA